MQEVKNYLPKRKKTLRMILILTILFLTISVLAYVLTIAIPSSFQNKSIRMIVIGKTAERNIAFWESLKSGIDEAAQEYNVSYEYLAPPSEADIDEQINLIYRSIAKKPDVIILAATDYERLVQPAEAVRRSGIKLIMVDSNIKSESPKIENGFVATDNVAAGAKAAQEIEKSLEKGKSLAIIAHQLASNSAQDRDKGVREGISDDIQILPTYDALGSEVLAYEHAKEILKNPQVGGIICLNEYSTMGALRALEESSNQIPLVGFDSSLQQIHALEKGTLRAMVIQRPFNMGYMAVTQGVKLLSNQKIDYFYDTGSILITKENMYSEENEKLLFPFL